VLNSAGITLFKFLQKKIKIKIQKIYKIRKNPPESKKSAGIRKIIRNPKNPQNSWKPCRIHTNQVVSAPYF
jgi:hypothetical protein